MDLLWLDLDGLSPSPALIKYCSKAVFTQLHVVVRNVARGRGHCSSPGWITAGTEAEKSSGSLRVNSFWEHGYICEKLDR